GKDGSVDWLCWPRFDSASCFTALLGEPDNGRWLIAPAGEGRRVTRAYRRGTLVLETRFETTEGTASVIDFMPVGVEGSHLVRIVVGEEGSVPMRMELSVRFDFGRLVPWVSRDRDGLLRAIAGPHAVTLATQVSHRGEGPRTVAEFTVGAGERVPFV